MLENCFGGVGKRDEFEKALAWTKEYCKEGPDLNTVKKTDEEKTSLPQRKRIIKQ